MCERMAGERIPEEVRRFLANHVNSVEQLEVLLLLRRTADRDWTAAQVADELRIDRASARRRLYDLHRAGLVGLYTSGTEGRFRYDPSDAHAEAVDRLADIYVTHRVAVITFIISKPLDEIRSFADAFRIRGKEEED